MKFSLKSVHYMPQALEPWILYVSTEFETAAHLCACGCGQKIRTPLGPTEWTVTDLPEGPTLRPSVGNWQQGCRSHYLITEGEVVWSTQWSEDAVSAGRRAEERKRLDHYSKLPETKPSVAIRIWNWIKGLFKR